MWWHSAGTWCRCLPAREGDPRSLTLSYSWCSPEQQTSPCRRSEQCQSLTLWATKLENEKQLLTYQRHPSACEGMRGMTCASLVGRGDSGSLRQKAGIRRNMLYSPNIHHLRNKAQEWNILPLAVHSAHTSQGHHGDIWNKKRMIRYPTSALRSDVCSWSSSLQLRISVSVDLAILLGQILIDLIFLDLGRWKGPGDHGGRRRGRDGW